MKTDQSKPEFTGQKAVTKTRRRNFGIVRRHAERSSLIADALSKKMKVSILHATNVQNDTREAVNTLRKL